MRLYRQTEVPEDEQGLLCRQSRLMGIVRLIIWCGVLAIAPVIGWKTGKPWVLWIGVALAAVVIPIAVLELAAMFRATNWLLRIGRDGLWINLRSYRDRNVVPDALSVLHLDYGEIARVGQHAESYTTPSEIAGSATPPGVAATTTSTEWRDKFLEIELIHDQTAELKSALNDLRFPPPPADAASAAARATGRIPTVWLVKASLLRIVWVSSHGPVIAPRLAQMLSELETYVQVTLPTRRERPNWRKLTAEEATELARELVHVHGAAVTATALLSRTCGLSHGEANTQVRQLEVEAM